jgi:hypothetical protein
MENTHNVQRIPVSENPFLVSGFYNTTTFTPQPVTARYTDCFPIKESQWATDPIRRVHKREGWTTQNVTTGTVTTTGPLGNCTVQAYTLPNIYTAKESTIYQTNYANLVVSTITNACTNAYSGWGTNAINDTNTRRVCWLGPATTTTNLVSFNEDGTSVTVTDVTSVGLDGKRGLVFINGYLFASNSTGTRIYNSDPAGDLVTWNSTNFLDAEQYADQTLWLAKHKNYLVAFGQASVEFFFDAGIEIGSPLKRQESYSTRIGLFNNVGTYVPGAFVCNIEDDLYFLGMSEQKQVGLYRIRNFQIEELDNQFIQGLMNDPGVAPYKIMTCSFNNNPHVIVFMQNSNPWVYFPKENTWWRINGSDFVDSVYFMGQPFISLNDNFSSLNPSLPRCFIPINPSFGTTQALLHADLNYTTTVDSRYITDTIDFGINRWKHLARIDAIGDFNANSVSVFCNPTPNYSSSSITVLPAYDASAIGYGNNISWYNIGAMRIFSLQFRMNGVAPGIFEAFDIEYNIGVA